MIIYDELSKVTEEDYDTWVANFGNTLENGALANAPVPEPASLILLLVGLVAILLHRRLVALEPLAA